MTRRCGLPVAVLLVGFMFAGCGDSQDKAADKAEAIAETETGEEVEATVETAEALTAVEAAMIAKVAAIATALEKEPSDAIAILENALNRYNRARLFEPFASVRGYYLLGTAYQRAGRSAEAIEQFEKFLDIWQNADPELEEVPDAKARLQQLKSAG